MGKHERLPPKMRTASGSLIAAGIDQSNSRSTVSDSSDRPNPFMKTACGESNIALIKTSGTRNKNLGFDGISKRKRVRLDKREKKKAMALAGKLKVAATAAAPSVSVEKRAKMDAAKERERKKRQKLKKKRMERAMDAAAEPKQAKKRRSRSQVAADAAAEAAVPSGVAMASASEPNEAHFNCSNSSDVSSTPQVAASKKLLRKLRMKEKRVAAKAANPATGATVSETNKHGKLDSTQRIRSSQSTESVSLAHAVNKKNRSTNEFPYDVDPSDHAETPAVAYADIVPVLCSLATALGKSHSEMIIFDPFYCQGSVLRNLAALGFTNVINAKQDFYSNPVPKYDVLLTNPPYSGDHIDKIVKFAAGSSKPWLLLLPNFVVGRPSYAASISQLQPTPFYVIPAVRYAYIVPSWVGAKATAPFPSFWYVHCAGPMPPPLLAAAAASSKMNVRAWRAMSDAKPLFIDDIKALPQDVRDVTDPLKKRPNPRARKRMSSSGSLGSAATGV